MNPDSQADVETRLTDAVQLFLDSNNRSEIHFRRNGYAIVFVPGMTWPEIKLHVVACLVTLGLWLPVFGGVAILRTPKKYLIDATDPRGVWTYQIDN